MNVREMLQCSDISKILMTIPVFDLPEIVFLSAELRNTRKAFGQQASVYAYADTYADIAKRVGISEKNVSVRLTLIRQKMKQYLIEREVFV